MIPLIPIALGVGAWYWWKNKHPHAVQAPPYNAPDGKVYNSPFMVDGNMPLPVAQTVVKEIMEDNDYSSLAANQAWLMSNGYPIAAQLIADKMMRVRQSQTHTVPQANVASGSIWGA